MPDKIEFASPAWLEALRDAFQRRVDAASPADLAQPYSVSETYTEVPARIDASGSLGFHVRIGPDGLDFRNQPSDQADFQIIGTYEAILPLARVVVDGDADRQLEMDRMAARAIEAGQLQAIGSRDNRPAFLDGMHDELARITA